METTHSSSKILCSTRAFGPRDASIWPCDPLYQSYYHKIVLNIVGYLHYHWKLFLSICIYFFPYVFISFILGFIFFAQLSCPCHIIHMVSTLITPIINDSTNDITSRYHWIIYAWLYMTSCLDDDNKLLISLIVFAELLAHFIFYKPFIVNMSWLKVVVE